MEAVIHPQFLADLLSPEQQRDPLALTEELEEEEGLGLVQVNLGGKEYQNERLPWLHLTLHCLGWYGT